MRESEVVFRLLKKFSEKEKFILKHVSVKGLYSENDNGKIGNCFISKNGNEYYIKDLLNWKAEVLKLFPNQFREEFPSIFSGNNGISREGKDKINKLSLFRAHRGNKEQEYAHYDVVIKNSKSQGDQRQFFIEAKGDSSNEKNTYIKGQIQTAMGQLILAGRKIITKDANYNPKLSISVGTNICLTFPLKWEKYLMNYLTGNKIYHEFIGIFGRKNKVTKNKKKFKSLFEFRFFLVGNERIKILNKDLECSSILWQNRNNW